MKKLSLFIQWLLVLAFLVFAATALLKGKPVPDRHPETWRSWQGFMALSYPGIGTGDSEVYTTPKRLLQQLVALREAGYHTITPEDALAFLKEDAPLPRKALLLLFEGGRKDSVIFTIKPFRKTGFTGVICLPTRMMSSHGAFFLRRGDFKSIAKMGFWQFAGMGHEAINEIPVGPEGETGHFLTRRKWMGKTLESPEDFQARVEADYASCAEKIEEETGMQPTAYIYPFADAGRGTEADPEAERINRKQVAAHFQMAFVQANNPFNGPGRNPFDLTRLRVPGNLSGEELARKLDRYVPQFDTAGDLRDPDTWQVDGPVHFTANGMEIPVDSAAWVRGSDPWSDVEIQTTLRVSTDARASLYARYTAPDSFLRVTVSSKGIRVQENLAGRMRTLHWQPKTLLPETPVSLRLRIKGGRAWLWHEKERIAGPLPLATPRSRGRVGLGSEIGSTQMEAFHATPLNTIYALAGNLSQFPGKDAGQTRALIVPLDTADGKAAKKQRLALLPLAAQGTEIIPRLPAEESPAQTLDGLQTLLESPITRSLIHRVAVSSPSPALLHGLHELGMGVILILPATGGLPEIFDPRTLGSDDMILLEGSEEESLAALNSWLKIIPAYRMIGFLDSDHGVELGLSRAIRYGP